MSDNELFNGYRDEAPLPEVVRLENITGWWTTTDGAPTWTPRSLREMIAIDPDTETVYFYHVETTTWIAAGGSGSGDPAVTVSTAGSTQARGTDHSNFFTFTNGHGSAGLFRVNFILRTDTANAGAGEVNLTATYTDDRAEVVTFESRDLDLTDAAANVTRANTVEDSDGRLIILPDGGAIAFSVALTSGAYSGAKYDAFVVVERYGDSPF